MGVEKEMMMMMMMHDQAPADVVVVVAVGNVLLLYACGSMAARKDERGERVLFAAWSIGVCMLDQSDTGKEQKRGRTRGS